MNNKHALLVLNRLPNVGPRTIAKLLRRWPDAQTIFRLSRNDLLHAGVPERLCMRVYVAGRLTACACGEWLCAVWVGCASSCECRLLWYVAGGNQCATARVKRGAL